MGEADVPAVDEDVLIGRHLGLQPLDRGQHGQLLLLQFARSVSAIV